MKDAEEAHIRVNNMYLLTELRGGVVFAGRTDLVQRGA